MAPVKDFSGTWVTAICFTIILSTIFSCIFVKLGYYCSQRVAGATKRLVTWYGQSVPKPQSRRNTPQTYALALVPLQQGSGDEERPLTPPAPMPTHGPRACRAVRIEEPSYAAQTDNPITQAEQPPVYASLPRQSRLSRTMDSLSSRRQHGRLTPNVDMPDDVEELTLPGPAYQPESAFYRHIFGF